MSARSIISAAALLVALATNAGAFQSVNIHPVNKAPVFSSAEAEENINMSYLDPETIAQLLARTTGDLEIGEAHLSSLLYLNSYNPAIDCSVKEFQKRQGICEKAAKGRKKSIDNYCQRCLTVLKSACANNVKGIAESTQMLYGIEDFKENVDLYARQKSVAKNYRRRLVVIDFLYSQTSQKREDYQKMCTNFNNTFHEQLRFFDLLYKYEDKLRTEDEVLASGIEDCKFALGSKL